MKKLWIGVIFCLLLFVPVPAPAQCTEEMMSAKLREAIATHPRSEIRENFNHLLSSGKAQTAMGNALSKWSKQATSFLGSASNGKHLPTIYFQQHWMCRAPMEDFQLVLWHQYYHVLDILADKLPPEVITPGEIPRLLTKEQASVTYESEARAWLAECQLAVELRRADQWKKECKEYHHNGVKAMRQTLAKRLAKDPRYASHVLVLRHLAESMPPDQLKE